MFDPRAYLTLYAVLCLLAVVPLTVSAILGKVRGYRRNGVQVGLCPNSIGRW